jgi:hypothetical protein
MPTLSKTILLAASLCTLAAPAHAQKHRKPTAPAASAVPAPAAPAPAAPLAVAPAGRVAVTAQAPVVTAAAPAVRVVAPTVAVAAPPQVTVYAPAPPPVGVQFQVSADSTYVASGPEPVAVVQAAPSCAYREEGDMQAVLAAIRNESFSSDQLRVLGEAAHGSCFTVAQVEQTLPLFSFEADQLKALQIMAPRILDRQNNFRIYGLFTFESGKQQARRILAR